MADDNNPQPQQKSAQDQFQDWMNSQSGYIGKGKKADWWNSYNQNQTNQTNLNQVMQNGGFTPLSLSGSNNENAGRIEGLDRAKILTGQNPYQVGQDYQQAYGNIKKRTDMSDTGSELLRANKSGAVADARQSLNQQGVKGGAAAGAVSQIERAKSYDVNNQLMQNQRQAQTDYMNAAKANANFTQANELNFGALAAGKDIQAPQAYSSGMGTVICTCLYGQGLMDTDTFLLDRLYGETVIKERPEVYYGYRFLADPIVKLMWKSKLFTRIVAIPALAWADNMAGRRNFIGAVISTVGEGLCSIVGKILRRKYATN